MGGMANPDPTIAAPPPGPERLAWNRRRFLTGLSGVGLGSTLLPGVLTACAGNADAITVGMLRDAQALAGLDLGDEELATVAERLNGERNLRESFAGLRDPELHNHTPPSFVFHPLPPGKSMPERTGGMTPSRPEVERRDSDTDLAFLPVTHLAPLVETGQVSSLELTELYLERLERFDPELHCVVSLTPDIARRQAEQADAEIAAGNYRGPLHGIPWGAKDLLAVRGTKTTWGASPYRDQEIAEDSTVYRKLTEAGAVLVAKLSMGALAPGGGAPPPNPGNPGAGSERLLRRARRRHRRRSGRFLDRNRDPRLDHLALDAQRDQRAPAHVRPREPGRGDGAVVDHGQDWSDVPERRGLRPGLRGDPGG